MADPLDPVKAYLRARSIRDLSKATGVPHQTIHRWLKDGVPLSVKHWLRVTGYLKGRRSS